MKIHVNFVYLGGHAYKVLSNKVTIIYILTYNIYYNSFRDIFKYMM